MFSCLLDINFPSTSSHHSFGICLMAPSMRKHKLAILPHPFVFLFFSISKRTVSASVVIKPPESKSMCMVVNGKLQNCRLRHCCASCLFDNKKQHSIDKSIIIGYAKWINHRVGIMRCGRNREIKFANDKSDLPLRYSLPQTCV